MANDLEAAHAGSAPQPDRAEFDVIVADKSTRRLGRKPSLAEHQAMESLAERLREQFFPRFGLLTAGAIAESHFGPMLRWSPERLVESILQVQVQQWLQAGITDEQLDLLYEATLTQGACDDDPEFSTRVDALAPATLSALSTFSEPGLRLGPIVPDLLGKVFVLMRLRGEATTSTRQAQDTIDTARAVLYRSWRHEQTAEYAALLLENDVAWIPQAGRNPADDIMLQALAAIGQGHHSFGLLRCCHAAALTRPDDRDWSVWLHEVPPHARRAVALSVSSGLLNATVEESDPMRRYALAELIGLIHTQHRPEPVVRILAAMALFNASVRGAAPTQCQALAARIEALHKQHGHEPEIRELLAKTLVNATVVEPDPVQRRELAARIEILHRQHGHEFVVGEELAKALRSAAAGEPDPAQRRALAARIEQLHALHGHSL
jgi:hypothetical protein